MDSIKVYHAPNHQMPRDNGNYYIYYTPEYQHINDNHIRINSRAGNHGQAILIDNVWVFHNDTDYAYKHGDSFYFFQKGISVTIENLPCDDYTKVILKLKYTLRHDILEHNRGNNYAVYV